MFDIGIGELIALAAIGLLIFGPERLPKAAADAGRWVRQIRAMATNARQELSESAGVDLNGAMDSVREFRDLHPRRLASDLFDDDTFGGASDASKTSDRPDKADKADKPDKPAQSFDPDLS
ncbi:MAG TPA: Sec-independent protein translocase protein TatB [Candidatus Nanopelagicales bacterium]|nr:Sec-independent protein translocase protein TatB [Candidatus Nanopelagicales bacterium]